MTRDSVERPLPHSWQQACEPLTSDPGIAMVIGASDSGKTTWVGLAARHLVQAGKLPAAIVDADVGQSTIGPPTTVALAVLQGNLPADFRIDGLPWQGLFLWDPSRRPVTCSKSWSGPNDWSMPQSDPVPAPCSWTRPG